MISKKYKWVLVNENSGACIYFLRKPKKLVNGFMDGYGKRIVGRGLYLATRKEHDS